MIKFVIYTYHLIIKMSEQQVTSTEFQDEPKEEAQPPPQQTISAAGNTKLNSNFYERTRTTLYMIGGFIVVLASGQFYSSLLVLFLCTIIFSQINSLKRYEEKEVKIPMTKYINWYVFIAFNYFCLGKFLTAKLPYLGLKYEIIGTLLLYHNFIGFCLFVIGFLSFVLSLKQGFLKYQFRLFGWILLASLLIGSTSWSMVTNIFDGLIWFIGPTLLIISNDIFAYLFGYFFGKHKLIALSPKKTWEGYIGGAISTFIFSVLLSQCLQNIQGLACPSYTLNIIPFEFPECQAKVLDMVNFGYFSITQLQCHFLMFSLFASIIGPFGGFFGSGLKRSIKIKDFGNSIPGHGGVTDRMDCQLIMGAFVSFYFQTFIRVVSLGAVGYILEHLSSEQQLELYKILKTNLKELNLI